MNQRVGDLAGNAAKILEWRAKAADADLVMVPELQLTGYPLEDLVLKPEFVRRSLEAAERLADVSRVSLKSALSTLDLNKRRAALGASSSLDVLRAEGDVQTARALVVATDEGLIRAREALGLALGSPEGYGVTPDIHLDALAEDAHASCHAEPDVGQRADVRAATANLRVSERAKGSVD